MLDSHARGWCGSAWLIQIAGKHYIISALADETMAFAADRNGRVTSFADLASVRRADHEACIARLLESLGGES